MTRSNRPRMSAWKFFRLGRPMRRPAPGIKPGVERLEARTVPATLSIDAAGNLTFVASAGVTNNLSVTITGGNYAIADTGETIAVTGAGAGAWTGSTTNIVTGPMGSVTSISIDLGDGNDTATLFALATPSTFNGGVGTDRVVVTTDADMTITNHILAVTGFPAIDLDTIESAVLTGGSGNNSFDASGFSAGPVTLNGGVGNDTLVGGSGNDSLDGGDGTDRFVATGDVNFKLTNSKFTGAGTDAVVSIESAVITGGAGNNTLDATGFAGPVTLDGGSGNDILKGGAGNDVLIGGIGNDKLSGGAGSDTLTGGAGNDNLAGGANVGGRDRVVESADANWTLTASKLIGNGTDKISGVEEVNLTAGPGNNVMDAGAFAGTVTLDGAAGNDRLIGAKGLGGDSLAGGTGNDTLTGNAGPDIIDGGAGIDRLIESANADFTLTNSSLDGPASDVLTGIEEASLTAGKGKNTLDASAFSGPVTLDGAAGNDTITGGTGNDLITSGTGSDSIGGGAGTDTIKESANANFVLTPTGLTGVGTDQLTSIEAAFLIGGKAKNTLDASGFGGPVTLNGGIGNDTIKGGAANDFLTGGLGNDSIDGGAGTDFLLEAGDVSLTLTPTGLTGLGSDTLASIDAAFLTGGPGDNLLDASAFNGPVTLDGGAGNDTLKGSTVDDVLTGGLGDDSIDGGAGTDILQESGDANITLTAGGTTGLGTDTLAGIEGVSLTGGSGNNLLDSTAFAGPVTLIGGAGNDTLKSGSGNDQLTGGLGDDDLDGGAGNNTLAEIAAGSLTLTATQLTGLGTDTLTNIHLAQLTGGQGDDNLDGSGFAGGFVTLIGGPGNDTLIGGPNNDVLSGGLGDDSIVNASGTDVLVETADTNFVLTDTSLVGLGTDILAGIGEASLTGGTGDNSIDATAFTAGKVTLDGGAGNDTIGGSAGGDSLLGGPGADVVVGSGDVNMVLTDASLVGPGTDDLSGFEGARLIGGASVNTLNAAGFTLGPVTLTGGLSSDALVGSTNSADVVAEQGDVNFTLTNAALVGLGTDTLTGIENASLVGGASGNTIDASAFTLGKVTLRGGAGDDTLTGSSSSFDVLAEQGDVNFTLSNGALVGQGTDTFSGLETASLTGGAGDNIFTVTSWTGSATLDGGGGTDKVISTNNANFTLTDALLTRSTGGSFTLTSIETAVLTGGNNANILDASGFSGRVTLSGAFNNDTLIGGSGPDDVVAESGNLNYTFNDSFIFGLELTKGATGVDSIQGIEGLLLTGGASANTLDVSEFTGKTTLTGAGGDDIIKGGTGDNTLVETGDVNFTLTDTGLTGLGTDVLSNIQKASLAGGGGANIFDLSGWSGAATVNGGSGTDTVVAAGDTDFALTDTLLQRVGLPDYALASIDAASLTGGAGPNDFDVSGWSGPASLDGGATGADVVVDARDVNFTLTDTLLTLSSGQLIALTRINRARLTAGAGDNDLNATVFTGDVTLISGAGADTLRAGAGDATLDGGDGDDTFMLGASSTVALADSLGTDTADFSAVSFPILVNFLLATGQSQAFGGTGQVLSITGTLEKAIGTAFDDRITGNDAGNSLVGGNGNDTLIGNGGDDTLNGGANNDSLVGGDGNDQITGAAGDDTLDGGAGNDTIDGGDDNDFLLGGDGNDTVFGGNGNDLYGLSTLAGSEPRDDSLDMGAGDDVAFDVTGNNTLLGGDGNDLLVGGVGKDSLSGGIGNDTLTGDLGDDTIDGGTGTNRLAETADVNLTLTDTALNGIGTDLLANIQEAELRGGSSGDKLDASGFTIGPVTLVGGIGADTLLGGLGNDQMSGGLGNDSVDGGTGTNLLVEAGDVNFTLTPTGLTGLGTDTLANVQTARLTGGFSANTLDAATFGGAATLDGGAGNDSLVGGAGDDLLTGGDGNDTLSGSAGTNTISEAGDVDFTLTNTGLTGLGTDTLSNIQRAILVVGTGDRKLDAFAFTNGPVTLIGGTGNDTLLGGSGDDLLSGGVGNDSINGGTGSNTVADSGDVNWTLTNTSLIGMGTDTLVNIQHAQLMGGDSDNLIDGSAFTLGAVTLFGGAGNDTLKGGTGDDSLDGGTGTDTLDGGLGTDVGVNGETLINIP